MSGLQKRVEALEQTSGNKGKALFWVEYPSDGGLFYNGVFYADTKALASSFGYEPGNIHIFGWQGQPMTAAELLAEAEERKRNPPPEVTFDELGEYGRKLAEEEGFSPAVAKIFERLKNG